MAIANCNAHYRTDSNEWLNVMSEKCANYCRHTFDKCDLYNALLRLMLNLTFFIIIWLSILLLLLLLLFIRMPTFFLCNAMQFNAMPRTFNRLVQRRKIFDFSLCIAVTMKKMRPMKCNFSVVHICIIT